MESENPNLDYQLSSETKITQHFDTPNDLEDDAKREENEAEEEDEEEEEFSFMCGGANTSPIAAEDAFMNGQIKPVFPMFNRDLFFSGEDLPMRPPVKKVFVETVGENGEADRKAVEASPDICKKSNSTGFSRIWRFKDLLGRSNSDGRDAFVFLNNTQEQPVKKEATVKVKKGKRAVLSAHEVYLKSKAKDEERRRSYLPYRPELMGFFTNVNGGLSKNVHPF